MWKSLSELHQVVDITPYGEVSVDFRMIDQDESEDLYDPGVPVNGRAGLTIIGDLDDYADRLAKDRSPIEVRLHSACERGDVRRLHTCDCGGQLAGALDIMTETAKEEEGVSILAYLPDHEARGLDLIWPGVKEQEIYPRMDKGHTTYSACEEIGLPTDRRAFGRVGGFIARLLREYDLPEEIELLTNNKNKIHAMEKSGLTVVRFALETDVRPENIKYLESKMKEGGHMFSPGLRDRIDIHDGSDHFPLPALNVYQGTAPYVFPVHDEIAINTLAVNRYRDNARRRSPDSPFVFRLPIASGYSFEMNPEMQLLIDEARQARDRLRQIMREERETSALP
jgi:GTP cyclohydrolase II